MSRRREYHIDHRFMVTPECVRLVRAECSPSERFIWVTRQNRMRVHTFRGVPSKFVDVLLPECDGMLACEVGRKIGCYDGNVRWRMTFRPWQLVARDGQEPSLQFPGTGRIVLESEGDNLTVLAMWQPRGMWAQQFPRLPFVPDDRDRRGILLHQWQSWFRFLPGDDVRQLAEMWSLLPAVTTCGDIVVLNRLASAALYDMAVQLGWRKLTLREKQKLGLDPEGPQWQKADAIQRRWEASRSGVGEYTERAAANGNHEYIRTTFGQFDLD